MKHTYTEKEKEEIAQLVFNWMHKYKVKNPNQILENPQCYYNMDELVYYLAEIKDVTKC